MSRDQFTAQALARYAELKEQLGHLRQFLITEGISVEELDAASGDNGHSTLKSVRTAKGVAKGKHTWDVYTRIVLRELGGKGKSAQAISYALDANPRLPINKVKDALRAQLSIQGRDGRLIVHPGATKTEGNEYELKADDEVYRK